MYKLYNLSKLIFHNIINYTIISNYKSIYEEGGGGAAARGGGKAPYLSKIF